MIKVFTNGCFDLLHVGHIELLKYAKSLGDYLIVGINSDKSVKRLKGDSRPINDENTRKTLLESLKFVDEVVPFGSLEELRNLHNSIRPNVVVKGSDWSEEHLRQADGILPTSKVIRYPLVDSYSSTKIIEKLRTET